MRHLAAFRLESVVSQETREDVLRSVWQAIGGWIATKGTVLDDGVSIVLPGDRVATLNTTTEVAPDGRLQTLQLIEPTSGGQFSTSIITGARGDALAVCVTLGASTATVAPAFFDVRGPRVIRSLLDLPIEWKLGSQSISREVRILTGTAGGDAFIDLVWSPSRTQPVVALSDEYGALLHPGILEAMASDLAGLAQVVSLDVEASWRVSARRGKQWSCYGGALRLYWPGLSNDDSPFRCPLWTPRRLLDGVADTEGAASRIRAQLRRRIFAQSAFAVSEPKFFKDIRADVRSAAIAKVRGEAERSGDYRSLAERYFEDAAELAAKLSIAEDTIADLRTRLVNAELALRYQEGEVDAVLPVDETPPATVEEAVLAAMDRFADTLTFGSDVSEGIGGLASDAGPPDKILAYLTGLADLTLAKRAGSLGTTTVKWLEQRLLACSGESETIRNNREEVAARTWNDGVEGRSRYFELHLKPSDATSPDRCVRIY